MLKIFLIAFVALAAIVLLKQIKPEFALLLKFATILLLGFLAFSVVSDAVTEIFSFGERVSIDSEMLKILLKALGLCLVAQIASDVCKDCGESALSTSVELVGKLSIVLMALPVAAQLIEISLGWINA